MDGLDLVAAREAGYQRVAFWEENPAAAAFELFADPTTESGRLELQPHQADVLQRVFAGHDVTWRAGHGVGKTTTLAILVFLWLILRPYSKVPTTAPTWHQVRNVLWTEIAKWYERFRFRSAFHLDKTRLSMRASPATWFAMGVASNRQSNIEGFHSTNLLYLVDEAKGVADPIYDAVDGALTEGGQRIYVSTPGSRTGKFYESHHGRIASFFQVVHTNGETAGRVSKKFVELKRQEWGEASPVYIAKVRGEFPQEGDDVLYPLSWVDAAEDAFAEVLDDGVSPAVAHSPDRYVLGCDVARFGFNKTVLIGGSSRRFDRLTTWERAATTETTARIIASARELEASGIRVRLVAVDDSGLGGGVTDQLREAKITVAPILFGGSPTTEGREYFANAKAEMAWKFRKALDSNRQAREAGKPGTFALVSNDRLKGQLAAMRRRYAGKGLLSIVDPDDPTIPATELAPGMKVSPDHAHAAIIAYHGATEATADAVAELFTPDDGPTSLQRGRMSSYIFNRRPR